MNKTKTTDYLILNCNDNYFWNYQKQLGNIIKLFHKYCFVRNPIQK